MLQCRLLQNAANSVLGQGIIAYAKHLGIKTINVVRRNEYINELKQKGCSPCLSLHVLISTIAQSFKTAIRGSRRVQHLSLSVSIT